MGRFFCDKPYGRGNQSTVFSCRSCLLKRRTVQLTHFNNIKCWEIMGPTFTGVFFTDIKHVYTQKEEKKGFYCKQGDHAIFDPHVTGLYTTPYYDVHCKVCHIHLGYHIPQLDAWIIFHDVLI